MEIDFIISNNSRLKYKMFPIEVKSGKQYKTTSLDNFPAKGGVVIGIVAENKVPVKFIGIGEQIDDMEIFNSNDFVNALI